MIRLIYEIVEGLLVGVVGRDLEYALPDNVRQQDGVGMWASLRLSPVGAEVRIPQQELEATIWLTFRGKRPSDVEDRMERALIAIQEGLPASAYDARCEIDLLEVVEASIDFEPVSQPVRGVIQLKLTGYISWRM